MWWYFVKIAETETSIIYDFGYESRELTGRFEYNKAEKKAKIIKGPDKSAYSHFDYTVLQLIEDAGAPDKKTIAYG
jgi:hypothetical protein